MPVDVIHRAEDICAVMQSNSSSLRMSQSNAPHTFLVKTTLDLLSFPVSLFILKLVIRCYFTLTRNMYTKMTMASNLITLGSRELQSRGFGNAHSSSILIFASESLFSSHCVFLCLKFVNLTACRFT